MSATFEQVLRISGFHPTVIRDDGKWRRCKTDDKMGKKNGAYVLHPDGRGYFKNWATDEGMNAWKDDNTTHAKPIDQARLQAQRDRERQYRIQSVRSARAFWNEARPLSLPHAYVANKGLMPLGCSGARTHDGLLVIPVMLGPALISIQTITHDGTKRFWPGAPVSSGSYTMRRDRASITILCEGFATGLALFQSVRNSTVIVCFDAGNMIKVAEYLRPKGSVVVFGDNDHRTMVKIGKNPGLDAARNTAELIGAGVAHVSGIEGSDADDYLHELGEGAARKLERLVLAKAKYVPAA